jgi:hypothetical protein
MDATRCRWDIPILRKIALLIIAAARCITIPARTLSGRITIPLHDPQTGEVPPASLFVAVPRASFLCNSLPAELA